MKKLKKLVVGNWKMNPETMAEAKKIAGDIKRNIKSVTKTTVVLCPPFLYIPLLSHMPNTKLLLGSQDSFYERSGSYTGEVSSNQLVQFNVSFAILGHSERRKKGERDEIVNKKVLQAVNTGMTAILCVGEDVRDHNGEYLTHIKNQVTSGLQNVSKKLIPHIVIAYEPVWAIGARDAMNARDVHEMAIFIKKVLRDLFGPSSDDVRILYGAAVNVFDCADLINGNFIHGFLIGRESLIPKDFLEIVKIVDKS